MSNSSLVTYTKISPNKTSPKRSKIDMVIIHCIVGQWTAKQGCDYFAQPSTQSSANYVVGKDGSIGLCVEEKDRAWTSGGKDKDGNPIRVNGISGADIDHRAITIEVASDTKHPYKITNKAYKALIDLLVDICKRNNIKELKWKADKSLVGQVGKQNMAVHRWFANKACPGDYLYGLHNQIAKEVNEKLGVKNEVKVEEFKPYLAKVSIEDLNMRTGPSTKYPSIGYIKPGVYTVVEENNKWGRLKSKQRYNGKWVDTWISLNYIKKV